MSSDYMFDLDSKIKEFKGPTNFTILESSFQPAIGIFTISFQNDKDGWTDEVSLTISNFKNPINRTKKVGFAVSISDSREVPMYTT